MNIPAGKSLLWIAALVITLGLATMIMDDSGNDQRRENRSLEPGALLGPAPGRDDGSQEPLKGYARALAPRPFVFPDDHGPHPRFRNEWWYFTGNLRSSDGRRFGYQLVVFRIALSPEPPERASRWGTNQIYMAHFAVTNAAEGQFLSFERFARGAAGLAGANADPFRVWLEDWSVAAVDGGHDWRLQAATDDVRIELRLRPDKAVVSHGDNGLSRKGPMEGNASYYYSITRIETHGIIALAGERYTVHGDSWLDREWGTSALADDQEGWDWFALQLDDGSDLMYYRLRREDGSADPFSRGTRVYPSGRTAALQPSDIDIEILDTWESPRGGTYPSRWRISVPREQLTLEVRPVMNDQELDLSVRYWEGAVDVTGTRGGRPVRGRGYVELVGYGSNT